MFAVQNMFWERTRPGLFDVWNYLEVIEMSSEDVAKWNSILKVRANRQYNDHLHPTYCPTNKWHPSSFVRFCPFFTGNFSAHLIHQRPPGVWRNKPSRRGRSSARRRFKLMSCWASNRCAGSVGNLDPWGFVWLVVKRKKRPLNNPIIFNNNTSPDKTQYKSKWRSLRIFFTLPSFAEGCSLLLHLPEAFRTSLGQWPWRSVTHWDLTPVIWWVSSSYM